MSLVHQKFHQFLPKPKTTLYGKYHLEIKGEILGRVDKELF